MKFLDCIQISPPVSLVKGKIYSFIEMANVSTVFREPDYIDVKAFSSGTKFEDGDTVIARIEPCLQNGKRFFVKGIGKGFGSTEFLVFRPKTIDVDNKYLYYFMKTEYIQQLMVSSMTGATGRQRVNNDIFSDLEISLPDLPTQRRIASILSAYDDLIENNRRQIKLLEEAAQRLYREWFVELRFPGYEDVKVIDGVPEGWKRVQIKDLIAYEIGGGWGSDAPSERDFQEAYVIRGTDLHGIMHGDYKNLPLRFHSENSLKPRILQDGDIVFEVSGGGKNEGVARTALISTQLLSLLNKPAICASFCKLIRPIEIDYSQYMYSYLQFLRASGKTAEYDKRSASSIVNYRWKDFLVQEYTLLPKLTVLKHFNRYIDAYYKKITTCANIISIASDTRDRLLSKLMSGEMEV